MSRAHGTAALVVAAALATARIATAATCTIVPNGLSLVSNVPSAGDFTFTASPDVTIPVDLAEAAGTLTMRRANLPTVNVGTQGGPVDVVLAGPDVAGTIDAAGHVSLPNFTTNTSFLGSIDLITNPTLSTVTQSTQLPNGTEHAIRGVPLDFSTGLVTLHGAGVVPTAPIVNEPVVAGLRITCRLEPIPNAANLPAAPALPSFSGTAVTGSASKGDTLAVKARLAPGDVPFDFAGKDVFLQLRGAAGDVVMLLVRAGGFKGKGKRFAARDRDGALVKVVVGRREVSGTPVAGAGTITVATSAKGATMKARVKGLDLSALSGDVVATVTVGPNAASRPVAVRGSGRKRKLG
jgi:hypothetical protein